MAFDNNASVPSTVQCNFNHILKKQGINFENAVIRLLKMQRLSNVYRNFKCIGFNKKDTINHNKYLETVRAMKRGVPIIYQAVLHDDKDKIYGCPDILVRNDYIYTICKDIKESIPKPPLKNCLNAYKRYYYIVIDVKSSTLNLRSNGNTLLNNGRSVASKGQIYIYHKIISNIQQFDSKIAFILGRKYKYVKMNKKFQGNGWFDRLGSIDFYGVDKSIIERVNNAIKWRREVQSNHNNMFIYPRPSHDNLYPNMCNMIDNEFRNKKRKISEVLGEHTSIGYVGVKHRKIAHGNKIYRFDDSNCTVDTLGITGDKRRKTVNIFLEMNKINNNKIFVPKKIDIDLYNWRDDTCSEAYVDFETIPCAILEKYNNKTNPTTEIEGQWIFLIGIWYKKNNNWTIIEVINCTNVY